VAGVLFAAVITLSGFPGWRAAPAESAEAPAPREWRKDPEIALAQSPHFGDAAAVVQARCSMCHAREPLWPGMLHAPKNVLLETEDDIVHNAGLIEVQAVRSHAMPPGNITGLEPEERRLLSAWLDAGDGVYTP